MKYEEEVQNIIKSENTNRLTSGRIGNHIRIDGDLPQSFISKVKKSGYKFNVIKGTPSYYYRECNLYDIKEVVGKAEEWGVVVEFVEEAVKDFEKQQIALNDIHEKKNRLRREIDAQKAKYDALLCKKSINGELVKRTGQVFAEKNEILRAAIPMEEGEMSGVYFLIKSEIGSNEIVYIGQSVNVLGRIRLHKREGYKQFNEYSYITCKKEHLNLLESLYIHVYSPKYNGNAPININNVARILLKNSDNSVDIRQALRIAQ